MLTVVALGVGTSRGSKLFLKRGEMLTVLASNHRRSSNGIGTLRIGDSQQVRKIRNLELPDVLRFQHHVAAAVEEDDSDEDDDVDHDEVTTSNCSLFSSTTDNPAATHELASPPYRMINITQAATPKL